MKYIPGFTFVPQAIKLKGGSVLAQAQKNKKILNDNAFKAGIEYKIHHIIPEGNQVKYIFLANNVVEEKIFKTIKDAEKKISRILGE